MSNGVTVSPDAPAALPSAPMVSVADNVQIQPPLSRRGSGPGLVLVVDSSIPSEASTKSLDPPPLQKWAEESYAVAQIDVARSSTGFKESLNIALDALKALPSYDGNPKFGVVTILSGCDPKIGSTLDATIEIHAVVSYGASHPTVSKPQIFHIAGETSSTSVQDNVKVYTYPKAGPFFVLPNNTEFHGSAASLSHTRTLAFLKPIMNGPYFDLEAIWEEHTAFEFAERAVDKTMATMVQEPYVNDIPTLTGGLGRDPLTDFYRNHFIVSNPEDSGMELVSRTLGIDRVIDEFVFSCTHDREIDWMVPGIPPTGKHIRVPFTAVVNVRGDRLYHEHISWDQGTTLRQLGLLPEYLPYPHPINGRQPAHGKRFEYRVPVLGVETASKLLDEKSVASNEMMQFTTREVDVN